MKIDGIIWLRNMVDKIASKHHVETYEVEEGLLTSRSFASLRKESEKARTYTWL